MAKTTTYTYQGFTFTSEAELKEAKKEAEVIAYIRAQADLSNVKTVVKLYNRLVEKGTMVTTLGISFLQELRSRALESGTVAESSLKPLPEPSKEIKEIEKKKVSKDRKMMEYYRDKSKNLTITVVILSIVIIVLFAIRLFGTASPFADYEQKVLDEYAGWKEELTAKEEELHEWEESLTEWEKELQQKEEAIE